jgi:hypothetical protein
LDYRLAGRWAAARVDPTGWPLAGYSVVSMDVPTVGNWADRMADYWAGERAGWTAARLVVSSAARTADMRDVKLADAMAVHLADELVDRRVARSAAQWAVPLAAVTA